MIKTILFCSAILLTTTNVHAVPKAATKADYDNVLQSYVDKDGPGVAAIVSQHGKVLYKGARGMANIEHNIPLETDSIFRLGSITKQFTGAAIMMLHEQGKLSIKDDIHKYVPDFPTEGQVITIEHLLTHTSGLANYTEDEHVWNKLIPTATTLDEMLIEFAKHPMPLKTGEAMRYSNTGYVLLGKIIEVASKQSYADYIEQHIFAKLGMKNSMFGGTQLIANRASGYSLADGEIVNASPINMMWPHAAGSLLSTVDDLNIWYSALKSGKLISKAGYQQMITPFTLNDNTSSDYGYGLGFYKVNKYNAIGHGGGIHGFVTNAFYLPEKDLYVAVLSNTDAGSPGDIALLLAAKAVNIDVPEFKEIKLSKKSAKHLLGSYAVSNDSKRVIGYEDGKFFSQRDGGHKWLIKPMSNNSFFYDASLSYFTIDKNDKGEQVMNFYSGLATTPSVAIKTK
ncbi:serine hydrolase domain-containing protein [Litorilituus sediminis]|uniref:Class A beta-lactamase-related serine hydrolase n=1 Tax=Litorilituus sediminis TaxID=718192 RepID=A0A4P6P5Y3_9GAMM|nr:serine hydrolase domain-containing protein [Litorilituus sediminis]QBG36874.1 class A beta-lactamase-related serine hydrolase [Litorilituus sediminis]